MQNQNPGKPEELLTEQAKHTDEKIRAHQEQRKKVLRFYVFGFLLVFLIVIVYLAFQYGEAEAQDELATNVPNQELSAKELEQLREVFKDELSQYEMLVQPKIEQIILADFENETSSGFSLQKDKMLNDFARGRFDLALSAFREMQRDAKALIERWQQATSKYLSESEKYIDQGQFNQAALSLSKARELNPAHPRLSELQSKLEAQQEIIGLMQALEVAEVERDLSKQIDLLQSIIDIDPNQTNLARELKEVSDEYQKSSLEAKLKQVRQAIDKREYQRARSFLAEAATIKPNSLGAQLLRQELDELEANENLIRTKQTLTKMASEDKWPMLDQQIATILAEFPQDEELIELSQLTQQVLRHQARLKSFVNRPERLSDTNVRQSAANLLKELKMSSLLSPTVKSLGDRLQELISYYSSEVLVTVQSDNASYVTVVGVGHVGVHETKEIKLKPGTYTLECRREGYRNKRITFDVEPDAPISVAIECDERL